MAARKIDQRAYKYYVFNTKTEKIITGWEYREDAYDFIKENGNTNHKVYTRTYLAHQLDSDPADNANWSAELGKPYKEIPEVVLYGDFRKDIQIPEIKIRYNKGKSFAKISSSKEVHNFLLKVYGRNIGIQEHFVLLLADNSLNIFGYYKHTVGTPTSTMADIPMLMGIVLKSMARAFIISHNHPSGNTTPSDADKNLTRSVYHAAETMQLRMLDHIIVTKSNGYYSFADNGELSGVTLEGTKTANSAGTLEKRLRKEIYDQLQKVSKNKQLTPKIYELIQTEKGYAWVERRIISMVIQDGITISACIPQIETELE